MYVSRDFSVDHPRSLARRENKPRCIRSLPHEVNAGDEFCAYLSQGRGQIGSRSLEAGFTRLSPGVKIG